MINAYNLHRLGAKIAPLIPVWLGNGLCDAIGLLIYWLVPSRRRAVLSNFSHVLADKSEKERRRVARASFKNGMRNYFDLFRVHALSSEERLKLIEVRNINLAYQAFERGKGVLVVAAHQGSFSFVAQIATLVNFDFYLAVEPIEPPELFELVRNLRSQDPRNHTISVGGSEVRTIFRALKANHMVCLAIDRDVTGHGEPMLFFGAKTKLPTGAAEIALRTGASIMPIQIYRTDKGRKHVLHFHPSFVYEPTADKAADTTRLSGLMLREVERMIRKAPEDWVVMQPIWPECEPSDDNR